MLAGRFDLAFALIYLYPLLILALSYNLISVEREQGTLAILLAQPVTLRTFVAGKIALRAGVILLPSGIRWPDDMEEGGLINFPERSDIWVPY